MNYLITGASGFIGRNLLLKLKELSADTFYAVFNTDNSFYSFVNKEGFKNIIPVRCDLSNKEAVIATFSDSNFDVCLHLAANSDPTLSVKDPVIDFKNNIMTTFWLLNFVKIRRFIYMSSGAVYDGLEGEVSPDSKLDPVLPYAIAKMTSEKYIQYYQRCRKIQTFLILRFFGAYGLYEPNRKIYTQMIKRLILEDNDRFEIRGDGTNLIDAMWVGDAVNALIGTIRNDSFDNRIYDLSCGSPITIKALVEQFGAAFGKEIKLECKGTSAEPIRFHVDPIPFRNDFQVGPVTGFYEGIHKLADFLKEERHE